MDGRAQLVFRDVIQVITMVVVMHGADVIAAIPRID